MFSKNKALKSIFDSSIDELCKSEGLSKETIIQGIENGTMVLLGNPNHKDVVPTLIGQPAKVKVNANIGTSPFKSDRAKEMKKLDTAWKAGAHAVMDLSTDGDLDGIRVDMLTQCPLPLGTVPIYAMAQQYVARDEDPAGFTIEELLKELEKEAEQGVDFMTLHCGLTRRGAEWALNGDRLLGIVSRGGSILARWMRDHDAENPLLTNYDRILEICLKHNVTLSLGDGLRPGAGADAGDAAQWEEVLVLGKLAKRAREYGVQAMIEGPGHVPMHLVEAQIRGIKAATYNAPLYVLGPLVTDSAPGYDHIAGAIGGAIAVQNGVDFLCYLTPAEHLTLPEIDDVWNGVKASLVAAQCGEVALGRPDAVKRDADISKARMDLDWDSIAELAIDPALACARRKDHKDEKECAMCGKFCAVRMLSE
ncbi:phosphomethylpyrimidine synthase ThiC [Maridesulfovibrio hydrothermalis]|uniref:Phosphomethylpyrimidine synthase n=1 Tax=Maridesulfovibrio hydrothermalis AM13 = DSM 14728 TaxID=1121451 RepID=L0REC1_9BACT|nr:phosphomethylpyrimidine synthase ThiC [Maridesulfovibrio hydrothermalis]CCO25109.1 Phosphomethylpyrimidine synthase [Maridesulfovibrio hydrothermalis AM13 = DSM 14728]